MAHDLTETASFDPTVTVPDGTDSRANAAEVVAGIAQVLANRTRALKVQADVSAKTNVANTFTAQQTFNSGIKADDGQIEVTGALAATGDLTAGGDIVAVGGLMGDGLVLSDPASEITINGTVIRYVNIPMCDGLAIDANIEYDPPYDMWKVTAATGAPVVRFQVRGVPRGATAIGPEAVWLAPTGYANVAELRYSAQDAWSASSGSLSTPNLPTLLATVTQSAGFSSSQCTKSVGFVLIPHDVDNSTEAFFVDVTLGNNTDNRLFALRIGYVDPGPRNG